MKKIFLLIFTMLLGVGASSAQTNLNNFKAQLTKPSAVAEITVVEGPIAKQALANYHPVSTVRGYQINVFQQNNQYARDNAIAAKGRLNSIYPNIGAEMTGGASTFTVVAGKFIDKIEAQIVLSQIKSSFTGAVIVEATFSVTNFQTAIETQPEQTTPTTF